MNGRFFIRIVLTIILIGLLAGAGVFLYNLGVNQGLASTGRLAAPVPGGTNVPYPYYYSPFFFHPWGFGFGFGFLGLIFPIFGFFLILSLIRGLFFWGGGGWRRWGRRGDWPNDVPPQVAEWHRRMHEQQGTSSGPGPSQPGS